MSDICRLAGPKMFRMPGTGGTLGKNIAYPLAFGARVLYIIV